MFYATNAKQKQMTHREPTNKWQEVKIKIL